MSSSKQCTKKQFASNEYATTIRTICLEITATENSLIFDTCEDRQFAHTQLKELKNKLIQLGITSNCKVHLDQSAYEDPETMAAYVAGQWLMFIDTPVIPLRSVASIIMEHSKRQSGPIRDMPGKDLPQYARNTLAVQEWIEQSAFFLDAKEEREAL